MTPTTLLIGTVASVLSIAIGSVWLATEWAAWHLGFQPQLGAPWFVLFGTPIYAYLEPGMQGLAWAVLSLIGPEKLALGGSVFALAIVGLAFVGGG